MSNSNEKTKIPDCPPGMILCINRKNGRIRPFRQDSVMKGMVDKTDFIPYNPAAGIAINSLASPAKGDGLLQKQEQELKSHLETTTDLTYLESLNTKYATVEWKTKLIRERIETVKSIQPEVNAESAPAVVEKKSNKK